MLVRWVALEFREERAKMIDDLGLGSEKGLKLMRDTFIFYDFRVCSPSSSPV